MLWAEISKEVCINHNSSFLLSSIVFGTGSLQRCEYVVYLEWKVRVVRPLLPVVDPGGDPREQRNPPFAIIDF